MFQKKTKHNCRLCGLLPDACMCDQLPKIETKTHLHLLIHKLEAGRATNSGQLAAACMVNSHVEVFGQSGWTLDTSRFKNEKRKSFILFPEGSTTLDSIGSIGDGGINLIVPDGNWRQGRKMYRKIMNQAEFPTVRLPESTVTNYHLRKETRPEDGLATFEAIALAIGGIEGEEKGAALLAVFEKFVNLHLLMRGLKRDIE